MHTSWNVGRENELFCDTQKRPTRRRAVNFSRLLCFDLRAVSESKRHCSVRGDRNLFDNREPWAFIKIFKDERPAFNATDKDVQR